MLKNSNLLTCFLTFSYCFLTAFSSSCKSGMFTKCWNFPLQSFCTNLHWASSCGSTLSEILWESVFWLQEINGHFWYPMAWGTWMWQVNYVFSWKLLMIFSCWYQFLRMLVTSFHYLSTTIHCTLNMC